ncbi:MAG: O-antigen ligase family protein [Pseudomonadota bacterium]
MRMTLKERRDRMSRRLFYSLFFTLPLTAVFGHKGVAPWLLIASLPAFVRGDFWQSVFGELFDKADIREPAFAAFLAISFFCFWILLSGIWSPKHHYALFSYVLAPALIGGSVVWYSLNLPGEWTYRLSAAFALSIVGGMIVLSFEGVTDGFLRRVLPPDEPGQSLARDLAGLGRGVTALAPALFPAAIIARTLWGRAAAAGILLFGVLAAFSNNITANAVAIALGLCVSLIAIRAPRRTLTAVVWLALGLLVTSPLLFAFLPVEAILETARNELSPTTQQFVSSWLHRLVAWQAISTRIIEGLPFGFGADFTRMWSLEAGMMTLPGAPGPVLAMTVHPHNIFLQIWLELGLPGVIAFGIAMYMSLKTLINAAPPAPVFAAAAGALAAILVSIMVEGSLWEVWRIAAMALAAMGVALCAALFEKLRVTPRGR